MPRVERQPSILIARLATGPTEQVWWGSSQPTRTGPNPGQPSPGDFSSRDISSRDRELPPHAEGSPARGRPAWRHRNGLGERDKSVRCGSGKAWLSSTASKGFKTRHIHQSTNHELSCTEAANGIPARGKDQGVHTRSTPKVPCPKTQDRIVSGAKISQSVPSKATPESINSVRSIASDKRTRVINHSLTAVTVDTCPDQVMTTAGINKTLVCD